MTNRVVLTCLALIVSASASAQGTPSLAQRHGQLTSRARAEGGEIRVIATVAGERGASAALRARAGMEGRARALGARFITPIADLPVVAMTVDEQQLAALIASGLIVDVHEDYQLTPDLASTIPLIGADQAVNAGATGMMFGEQALVAILDTGVDAEAWELDVVQEYCFSTTTANTESTCAAGQEGPGAAAPCQGPASIFSNCNHGTLVAGIAAGEYGVAPQAGIVAVNAAVKGTCGLATCLKYNTSDLLNALATLSNYSVNVQRIAAINISLSSGPYATAAECQAASSQMNSLVNAIAQYTPVVATAGNGNDPTRTGWPACIASAIAVGNTEDSDVVHVGAVDGSNGGTLLDLWAPGTSVTTTWGTGTGTSFAAPHVTGTLALMRQLDPDLYWMDALTAMQSTGVSVTDTRAGGVTRARLDTHAAVALVSQNQNVPSVGEEFGQALATGDFNLDGYDDLAIGVRQDVGSADNVGAVDVYYGSESGPAIIQVWDQAKLGATQVAGDRFGEALVAGDFNNDGVSDLAIGAPGKEYGSVVDAGAVYVLHGSLRGLSEYSPDVFAQSTPNIADTSETGDEFGQALAVGDFNDDGVDDLAIGVPNELVGSAGDAGGVHLIYGATLFGLSETVLPDAFYFHTSGGMPGDAESVDHLGAALAAGDFDHDGYDDLAIGEPGDVVAGQSGAGSITILFGSTNGARPIGRTPQLFSQEGGAVNDDPEVSDAFGYALAAGDFDNDTFEDLVVGVPNEDFPSKSNAGAFHLFKGTGTGLSAHNMYTQDSNGVNDQIDPGDKFGYSLAAGDLNSDGYADLLCGAPNEDNVRGIVHVIYGSAGGLSATAPADQTWTQGDPGVPGSPEDNDQLGFAVAIGDFNGGGNDIAVSVPNEVLDGVANAGYVDVLFQGSSGITGSGALGLSE